MAIEKTHSQAILFHTFINIRVSYPFVPLVATSLLAKLDYKAKLTNIKELNYSSTCSNLKLLFTKMKLSHRSDMVRLLSKKTTKISLENGYKVCIL